MQHSLWQQGVELMLFGMGTVFVFLTILIVMTVFMSALIQRFVSAEPAPAQHQGKTAASDGTDDDKLLSVISAAIHKYRSRHK